MKEKLGHLNGGSDTLLNALSLRLQAMGVDIRLSSPVNKVEIKESQISWIHFQQLGQSKSEKIDAVISTIPLPFVPRIIPDLPAEEKLRFENIKNIAVICVIAKLTKPVSENFWVNTNDPEMDIPGFVEYSNLRPLNKSIIYVPFYMPGEHAQYTLSDEVFINKVQLYLQKVNPALTDKDFLDWKVSRYRFAQPVCLPGHLAQLPPVRSAIQGLWIADTSHYYPEDRGISESIAFGKSLVDSFLKSESCK
jgi:hypothetical protein